MQINVSNENIDCVKSNMNKAGYQKIDYLPNYEHWVERELWTIEHTLALLAGVDPYFVRKLRSRDADRYIDFLECTGRMEDMLLEGFPVKGRCPPEKAITIAREKGLKIPSELEKYFLDKQAKHAPSTKDKVPHTALKRIDSWKAAIRLIKSHENDCIDSNKKFTATRIAKAIDKHGVYEDEKMLGEASTSWSKKPGKRYLIEKLGLALSGEKLVDSSRVIEIFQKAVKDDPGKQNI